MNRNVECCSSSDNCCNPNRDRKKIVIDFLYLDLKTCERCQGTDESLINAISDVSAVLTAAGYDIIVNKLNITTKELAVKYEFMSSPTIRINGEDISLEIKESECRDCGQICGDNVDCRVWSYEGKEYTMAPKELIVNAILKSVYSEKKEDREKKEYKLPKNLANFFHALEKQNE